ncbi:MAG: hypothetical protein AAF934_12890 [Bacteroidota bacterium]
MKEQSLTETTVVFKHREWQLTPDAIYPNCFSLKEIKTGKVLTYFVLYQNGDTKLLNRIACAPELEDIAEMYDDATIGNQAKAAKTATTLKHREWQLIPNGNRPDWFDLGEIETSKVLGTFVLPEDGDSKTLDCIASAPKWEHIAKTYYKHLSGSTPKGSIVFAVVKEVLRRLAQEHPYT